MYFGSCPVIEKREMTPASSFWRLSVYERQRCLIFSVFFWPKIDKMCNEMFWFLHAFGRLNDLGAVMVFLAAPLIEYDVAIKKP